MTPKYNAPARKVSEDERAMKTAFAKEMAEMEKAMSVAILAKDVEIGEISKAARDALEVKRVECEAALTKMRTDCQEKIRRLNEKLEHVRADFQAAQEQWAVDKENEKANFKRQIANVEDKAAKKLQAQQEAAAQELRALTDAFESKIAKLQAALKEDAAKLEAQQAAKMKEQAELEAKYKKWLDEEMAVDAALKEERDLLKKAANKLQTDMEKQIAMNSHQAEIDAREMKARIEEERAAARDKIKQMELLIVAKDAECKAGMEEFAVAKDAECAAKVAYIAEQLEKWQRAHDQLVHEHEAAIIALEDELRRRAEAKEKELKGLLTNAEKALAEAKKDRSKALTDKDASCAELRHEYEMLLDEANKKAQEALAKAKKDAMDAVHQKDDDIRQITADCRSKIAEKDKQLADFRKSSEEQLKRKDAQLVEQANNLNAKLAAEALLKQKRDESLKDLKAQLDSAI